MGERNRKRRVRRVEGGEKERRKNEQLWCETHYYEFSCSPFTCTSGATFVSLIFLHWQVTVKKHENVIPRNF